MRKYTALFITAALMLTLTACTGAGAREQVIIAGSTSVQPYVGAIAEDYAIEFEVKVNVQGGGSGNGITSAKSGTADIGMSSRALKEEEIEHFTDKEAPESVRDFYTWYHRNNDGWDGKIPNYVIIARDGLALIMHRNNPVTVLTTEQVRGIYTGKVTHWCMLRLENHPPRTSDCCTRKEEIHVFTREEGSGTRTVFEEEMMTYKDAAGEKVVEFISNKAMVQSTNGTIKANVEGNPQAIGYISLGMVDKDVKGVELNGIAPTVENVNAGLYTFYRPFLFVLNPHRDHSKATLDFISYILSERGQKDLADDGLVPVRAFEREGE